MRLDNIKLEPILDTLKLEDIDDEIYFSKKYAGYISNSRLSLINPLQDGSPEKFFKGLLGNKVYSDSLIFGSAVHELTLQPESFELINIDRPTAKCGFIADLVYKKDNIDPSDDAFIEAATEVDYYKGNLNDNKLETLRSKILPYLEERRSFELTNKSTKCPIYLDSKNRERLKLCLDALRDNHNIQNLLHPKGLLSEIISQNEKTILLDLKVTVGENEPFILKLKSKLDNFTISEEDNTITVNDVKTTGKLVSDFEKAIDTYHYYREMGMYSYLLSLCAKKYWNLENPIIKSNFLVVSTIPQYYTKVVPMNKYLFMKGFNEFKELVKMVAYYVDQGYTYQ